MSSIKTAEFKIYPIWQNRYKVPNLAK